MRIFVDENIPNVTVKELISLGHEVRDIPGTPEQGMETIIEAAFAPL